MGVGQLNFGPNAPLFSLHIDWFAVAGLFMDDICSYRRTIGIGLLGDEFLEAVNTGEPIDIHADGTVEVGLIATTAYRTVAYTRLVTAG
ncbi:MAG: hypothetical protein K0U64_09010 [Actinomycetia bacterium]|nr:hypothetical protein [Actinomycetes bacterium]